MPNIFTLETSKYNIKIDNFEGPLDLLCHLIEVNKMDIYDVNINEITDQYIAYINEMQKLDLEVTSEFLVMASNLLYIKSKKLLPKQSEENGEEMFTEEELMERIIEYKQYKEISKSFSKMYSENSKKFFRISQEKIELPKQTLTIEYSLEDLIDTYKKIITRNKEKINKNAKNIEKIAIIDNYTVEDTVKKMFRELIRKRRFTFGSLFPVNKCEKQEVVTAFSGLLEMSRRNKVITSQDKLFGEIEVEKKPKVLSEQ